MFKTYNYNVIKKKKCIIFLIKLETIIYINIYIMYSTYILHITA